MTTDIFTISPDTLVYEAVQLMLEHMIHQLVIITRGGARHRPVAIFTSGDAGGVGGRRIGTKLRNSEAQIRCSDYLRKLISIGSENEFDQKVNIVRRKVKDDRMPFRT
jgi:CBS domain-containing protein